MELCVLQSAPASFFLASDQITADKTNNIYVSQKRSDGVIRSNSQDKGLSCASDIEPSSREITC